MKSLPEYELLSGYLDGELTAAEQARVERLLADDPSARQLLDEFRTLGSTLRSLPREKMNQDLSAQVLLAAAQRKTSAAGTPQTVSQLPQPYSSGKQLGRKIAERIKNNPRIVVWPIVIITVAVLLMVFNPEPNGPGGMGGKQIAQAPAGEKTAEKPDQEERATDAEIVEPKEGELAKAENQPSISAAPSPGVAPKSSHLVMKGNPSGGKTQIPPAANSGAPLIVIQCQMSREAFARGDYRKVFEANNIALPEKSAADTLQATPAEIAEAAGIDRTLLEGESSASANANAKVKAIAVEVAPAQMAGIMNSLRAQPDAFREVSVRSAQIPQAQPKEKTPSTKRMLFIFRVVDAASMPILGRKPPPNPLQRNLRPPHRNKKTTTIIF